MFQEVATSRQMELNVVVIDPQDLPHPWTLCPADAALSDELERVLVAGQDESPLRPSWELIQNSDTGERAWLRLQGTPGEGVAVTALVFLPTEPGQRISNRTLRSIPLAGIETSIDGRRVDRRLKLANLLSGEEWDPLAPVGSPRDGSYFYERVALQFLHLKESGESRPVARMVELNSRPAKTVQGWVTEARKFGLLPPGKQGKAG